MQFTFNLPWPPSVNAIYRRSSKGVKLTRAAKRYRDEVLASLIDQRDQFGGWPAGVPGPPLLTGSLRVHVTTYQPLDGHKHDLDNLFKATLDALQEANVFYDDVQIDEIGARRGSPTRTPFLSLTIGTVRRKS